MVGCVVMLPTNLQFLVARTLINGVSKIGFKEVLEIVKNGSKRAVHRKSKKKDWKALFLIHQCVNSANLGIYLWQVQPRLPRIF